MEVVIQGIDYFALVADATLKVSFDEGVKQAVASEAGNGINSTDVHIKVLQGSLIVQALINLPSGVSAAVMHSQLSDSMTFSAALVVAMEKVPNIDTVRTGTIMCSSISVTATSKPRTYLVDEKIGGEANALHIVLGICGACCVVCCALVLGSVKARATRYAHRNTGSNVDAGAVGSHGAAATADDMWQPDDVENCRFSFNGSSSI